MAVNGRPPRLVPTWYMALPSSTLRPGGVRRADIGGEEIVLFRGRATGTVRAAAARCEHQGVDLAHGDVVGERLRCPLHHWEYGSRCERIPGFSGDPRPGAAGPYLAAERYGMVFVHVGSTPAEGIPSFSVPDEALHFRAGRAVEIDCPWYVPVANAFDMGHLETVHRRKLMSEPSIDHPTPLSFHVRYRTSVTGAGWSDRTMRLLSGDDIRVQVTCSGGTLIMVESAIRHWRAFLLVSLRPTATGVSILPVFGVPRARSGSHRLRARLSAALFTDFLRRDIRPLSGIRFPDGFLDNRDPTINACYRFLCQLPEHFMEETR